MRRVLSALAILLGLCSAMLCALWALSWSTLYQLAYVPRPAPQSAPRAFRAISGIGVATVWYSGESVPTAIAPGFYVETTPIGFTLEALPGAAYGFQAEWGSIGAGQRCEVSFPLWVPIVLTAAPPAWWWRTWRKRRRAGAKGFEVSSAPS
jgi:hypothetical protein